MKRIFFLLVIISHFAFGQKDRDNDKLIDNLEDHIEFLADDKLEGRRTGTAGEQLAYKYISRQFKKAGLSVLQAAHNYIQPFDVHEGRELAPANRLLIYGKQLKLNTDYFPLAYSGNYGLRIFKGNPRDPFVDSLSYFDLRPLLEMNKTNPHFDLDAAIVSQAAEVASKGGQALIVTNSSLLPDNLRFDVKNKMPPVAIPVVYVTHSALPRLADVTTDRKNVLDLNVLIESKKRTGHNVIGFIDNNASHTVVLGAHYDHLGYGEDHNSLYAGNEKMIHNGADDNASGTAALIELARMIKKSTLKKNNYLFVAFSGEELGLFGSKHFVENAPVNLSAVNYMINMDMVGRLNDSSRGLTIGGVGTSSFWKELIIPDPYFKLKFDSSGSGPSDHTSFYRKDIPVLFFFTGTHMDYHKPSDDEHKINYTGEAKIIRYIYNIIEQADGKGKLSFSRTREAMAGKSSFKVSLGIMPDYTFSGNGVLVEGVSEGRAAQKAGIRTGDILYQLGDHSFSDVQSYMGVLNKFNKGESTRVKVMRGSEALVFDISF